MRDLEFGVGCHLNEKVSDLFFKKYFSDKVFKHYLLNFDKS